MRKGEDKYGNFLNDLPGIYYRTDEKDNFVLMSNAGIELFGFDSLEDLGNKSISKHFYLYPEKRKEYLEELRKNNGYLKDYEIVLKKKDGTPVIISDTSRFYYDKEGKFAGIEGSFLDITERVKIRKELKKSKENYQILLENQTDLVVKVDIEGKFLFISPSYCEMFGKNKKELLGKKFMPLVHEDDQANTAKAMENLYKPPYTCYVEQRAKTKKGWKWLAWADKSILNKNGEVIAIVGVGRDISERKQNEIIQKVLYNISKAANSDMSLNKLYSFIHQELHKITDASNFHISLLDNNETVFTYFSDEKDRLELMESVGASSSLASYVTRTGKSILVNYRQILKMASEGKINLSQLGTLTANVVWLGVPLKIKDNIIGSMAVLSYTNPHLYKEKDIELLKFVSSQIALAIERKRTEEEIQAKQQEFVSIFHHSPEALIYVNEKSIILDANHRFAKMFGYDLEEIKGKSIHKLLIHPKNKKEESQHLYQKALKGSYFNYETIRRKKNGRLFLVSISCSLIIIEGKNKGRILSYRDISERRKNEKIQEVLYNISKATNSSVPLEYFYPLIHKELSGIIDASNFYIALLEKEKDILYFPYHVDERDNTFPLIKFSSSNALTAKVIKTGKPLLNSSKEYEKMVASGEISRLGSTSPKSIWLGVPLKIRDRVIGAMAVQSYDNPLLYSKEDIHLLEYVSEQIATAIERKRMEEELKRLAHYDPLTDTYNRAYGLELLKRQIKVSNRKKTPFLVGYVDMDGLKDINDEFGHEEGDFAIHQIAYLFKTILREVDIVTRIGGDEFLLVFPENSIKKIPVIKKRLFDALARYNRDTKKSYQLGFSIGFSAYDPEKPESIDELIRVADQRMYEEKNRNNKSRK